MGGFSSVVGLLSGGLGGHHGGCGGCKRAAEAFEAYWVLAYAPCAFDIRVTLGGWFRYEMSRTCFGKIYGLSVVQKSRVVSQRAEVSVVVFL